MEKVRRIIVRHFPDTLILFGEREITIGRSRLTDEECAAAMLDCEDELVEKLTAKERQGFSIRFMDAS